MEEIARERRRVRKAGKHLRELSAGKQHKLRIAAKNLRYAIEFFASLFPADKNTKRRQAALSALKDLQDALGALNDIVARENLMSEEQASLGHALPHAVSKESKQHKVEALRDEAVSAYDRFAAPKPFRRWRGHPPTRPSPPRQQRHPRCDPSQLSHLAENRLVVGNLTCSVASHGTMVIVVVVRATSKPGAGDGSAAHGLIS